jgi:VWFA-related protein
MSSRNVLCIALLLSTPAPVSAQKADPLLYKVVKEGHVTQNTRERNGKPSLVITIQFTIEEVATGHAATDIAKDEIIVEEDHRRVADLEIYQPRSLDPLTVVLVMDTSGSMAMDNKLTEAKRAARLLLDTLHENVDCGLILFDHQLRVVEPPAGSRERFVAHRQRLRQHIDAAQAIGGTAYLDATAKAVELLRGVHGRKAILLVTDGIDLNSTATLDDVKKLARAADVRVYTLGVGEPGQGTPVTTVLVLDTSGSMRQPADSNSKIPKIVALRQAAGRFVQLMRPGARTELLPFNTDAKRPDNFNFTDNKQELKKRIERLRANGETALFDAIFNAVETLVAADVKGKRAIIALTDGIDNRSRRRVDEAIEYARKSKIAVHMLGLGRPRELDQPVMERIAKETGGQYHHASNEEKLVQIFEDLSIELHDDGFDHDSLVDLASATGGRFYHARNARDLQLHYRELSEVLQSTYTVTFPSQRPSHDGTSRGIDIYVVRQGKPVSSVASFDYQVHGVVVPKMDRSIYLGLLGFLGILLVLPGGVRRLYRFYGGN